MSGYDHINPYRKFVALVVFTIVILLILGCNLISVEYWTHRLNDEETNQASDSLPTVPADEVGAETDSNFGSNCLNSTGSAPCPIDACVVDESLFTTKNVITSELFGKSNSSDYQCCASFQFTNNSGVDLMRFEHKVTEYGDDWLYKLYPAKNPELSVSCANYFTRKNGIETLSKGVTEIVVLYANPHCDWIQWDEPGLAKYRKPVEAGCFSNSN
jgi:hypothetical protein